jgi:LPS export ABC transporter protein LptC
VLFNTLKKIVNEKSLGIIGLFLLVIFFILTFYLNKKVKDGDLIFLLSNNRPPSLILKNFSAIRTNNDGLIIVSFDAKELNYHDNLKNGEIFNPRIFLADLPNKKEIELSSTNATYNNKEGSFILKNNVKIKVVESNKNSLFFQSDQVSIDTKSKAINAIGNVNATIY